MDFIVKVGDDGYQFTIQGLSKEDKVQQLQEMIAQEIKIVQSDQLLLTKKGCKLNPSDLLSSLEVDAQMLQTVQQIQDMKQQAYTIYVFDQSESEWQRGVYSSVSSSIDQKVRSQPEVKFLSELRTSLSSEFTDIKKRELLSNLNGNIFNMENSLFQYLQSIKVFELMKQQYQTKYLPYSQKIRWFEKLSQELENQVQSFDVVLKMISLNYQYTKQKKIEVFKKCKDSLERNSQTVKKFDESIANLKRIELHQALQTDQQKFLSDIYYKPEAMQKWKNNCINTSQNVKSKLEKTDAHVKKMKKRIKEERNNTIQTCVNTYKNHSNAFQQFIQESKSLFITFLESTIDQYSQLREHMQTYVDNPNDEPSLFFISGFEMPSDRIKKLEDTILHLSDHLEKVAKSIDGFTKLKSQNQSSIASIFKVMRGFNVEFEQLNDKIKLIDDEVEKMEKDFSYLLNPTLLPQAYASALSETSRRREFRDVFDRLFKQLCSISDQEKERRKRFLGTFGRILPNDFIPQLKHLAPSVSLTCPIMDHDLPDINGMHSDGESYRAYLDGDAGVQNKQIEDLNEQLKQTHQFYSSTRDPNDKQSLSQYKELLCMTAQHALSTVNLRWVNNDYQSLQNEAQGLQQQILKHQELLKSSQNQLLDQKDRLMKEQDESRQYKDKIQSMELKLVQIQEQNLSTNKIELDKLKQRIRQQDVDLSNKQAEIEKLTFSYVSLQKDIRTKQEDSDHVHRNLDQITQQYTKSREDQKQYVNKCENLELCLVQKNTDIGNLQKQVQSMTKERQTLNEQVSQLKAQQQETNKKIRSLQDAQKSSEDERGYLKGQLDKIVIKQNKKQQNDLYKQEVCSLKNELSRAIKSSDVESDRIEYINELQRKVQFYQEESQKRDSQIEELQKRMNDIKIINEQLHIECEIQAAKTCEMEARNIEVEEVLEELRSKSYEEQLSSQEVVREILEEEKEQLHLKYKNLLNQHEELEQDIQRESAEKEIKLQDTQRSLTEMTVQYSSMLLDTQNQIKQYETEIAYITTKYQRDQQEFISQVSLNLNLINERLVDEGFSLDLQGVKVGCWSIFLPVSAGVYVPLVIDKIENISISQQMTALTNVSHKKMILNQSNLQQSLKDLMIDTGLIIIAQVQEIKAVQQMKSSNFLEDNEEYLNITIDKPRYMIGFEESDVRLKNFTV